MPRCGNVRVRGLRLVVDGFLKIAELSLREHHEKGLKQYDGFPKASIKVVVAGVHLMPAALWVGTEPLGKIFGCGAKVPVQIFNHFAESADFMEKLKSVRKEHPVQDPAHTRGTLAPQPLIVLRV